MGRAAALRDEAARHGAWPAGLALMAGGAIAGALIDGALWLHYLCKPGATLLLIAYAARARVGADSRYRRWIIAGLVCSLVGDVCLMLPVDAFVAGLAAFLVAHLCYIAALRRGAWRPALIVSALAMAAYAGFNVAGLWPHLPAALRGAVLAYTLVLAAMAALALSRAAARPAPVGSVPSLAALGALLFVASDSILAWDRFATPWPAAAAWVLASYYGAQWCIARSAHGAIAVSAQETGAG